MKNLKKLMAVVLAVAMLATSLLTVTAAGDQYKYLVEAQKLYDMGLYQGVSTTSFDPDLGSSLTREQGFTMLVRMFGGQSAAEALSNTEINNTLSQFKDASSISDWARPYVAFAVKEKMIQGRPDGTIGPKDALLGKDYATLILRALGYEVGADDYHVASAILVDKGGLTADMALKFNDKPLIRDDFVGITFAAMNAKDTSGVSIIAALVEAGVVSEAKALANGLYTAEKNLADAKAAVAALQAAANKDLTVEENIAAAEKLVEGTKAAVAKVEDVKLESDLAAAIAKIEAARKAFNDKLAQNKAAEDEVAALEAAVAKDLTVEANLLYAEGSVAGAEAAVETVKDATVKAALKARVDEAKAKLAAARTYLDAKKAVDAYKAAPYTTLEEIAAAEALEAAANTAVAKVADATKKAALEAEVAAKKALVAAKKAEITPIAVESVVANNLKAIVVNFTKPVDKNTITTSTVTVAGQTIKTALSNGNKTLTIELGTKVAQNAAVKLTLNGVKDSNGIALAKYEQTIDMIDVTIPVAQSVNFVSKKKIEIIFSEPVDCDTAGIYKTTNSDNLGGTIQLKIDDAYAFAKLSTSGNKLVVDFLNNLADGNHTVYLAGVPDYAGFKMSPASFSFNVTTDNVKPVATSVEAKSTSEIVVTFSENITIDGSPVVKVKETGGSEITIPKSALTADKTSLKIDLSDIQRQLTAAALVGFQVTVKDVQDAAGNKCDEVTLNGVLVDDQTPPTIVSYEVTDDNKVRVVFSEAVDGTPTFKLYKADGKEDKVEITWEEDKNKYDNKDVDYDYLIDIGKGESNIASYTLEIKGLTDKSIRKNPMGTVTLPITTKDTIAPEIKFAIIVEGPAIEITFSEPMDASTINNVQNYFLKVKGEIVTLIGTKAKISSISADNTKVVLSLKDTGIEPPSKDNNDEIAVIGAKDANGKALVGDGATIAKMFQLDDAYKLISADDLVFQAIAPNKIKVTFGKGKAPGYTFVSANASAFKFRNIEPVSDGVYNFVYTDDFDMGVIAAQIASDGRSIELTTSVQFNADASNSTVVDSVYKLAMYIVDNVNDVDVSIKDMNGNKVVVAREDAIQIADKIGATHLRTERNSGKKNEAWLVFDEDIDYASSIKKNDNKDAILASGIEVKDKDGKVMIPVVDYTVKIDSRNVVVGKDTDGKDVIRGRKVVVVTVEKRNYTGNVTIAVKRPEFIKDAMGNAVTVRESDTFKVEQSPSP
ncbi:MAG TPA: hypothetical protein GXX49_12140 [Clostridiaceae bacterium]|nr:hypothetical protein [Clostridiaceae bacterium]